MNPKYCCWLRTDVRMVPCSFPCWISTTRLSLQWEKSRNPALKMTQTKNWEKHLPLPTILTSSSCLESNVTVAKRIELSYLHIFPIGSCPLRNCWADVYWLQNVIKAVLSVCWITCNKRILLLSLLQLIMPQPPVTKCFLLYDV